MKPSSQPPNSPNHPPCHDVTPYSPYPRFSHCLAARPEHAKELGRWCWVREEKEREGDRHAEKVTRRVSERGVQRGLSAHRLCPV
eukprot:scaffold74626_cov65-Phaeocystis_antarctica.AAC.2